MSQTAELVVKLRQVGGEQLTQLAGKLNNLGKQTAAASTDFKSLAAELKKTQAASTQSINNLKGYANAWREIANSVKVGSQEFKEATIEAAKLERQLEKAQRASRAPVGMGARLKGAAGVAGSVASAGIFGGPEGAIGALIGGGIAIATGGVGAPIGAAIGGAIGGGVGGFRQQLGAQASYAAELEKQRTALAGLTGSYREYQSALKQVESLSQQFAIPQEIITRQFTKLAASVKGAGGNLQDTETAFRGVAAGIRGTGGDLQDLDSALTATAQVFSKGKVSAEELRQQIGERLPGAFTLFAQSLDMTPAELDKALEKGQVSLQDFQKFSELLFQRFGKSAEAIVNSPAAAGDRLQVALSKLNENVGKLLAPIGAAFQNVFTGIVVAINQAVSALNRFFRIDISGEVENLQKEVTRLQTARDKATGPARMRLGIELASQLKELDRAQKQRALKMAGTARDRELTGLPGAIPGGGTAQRTKTAKEIVDLTKEELGLIEKINKYKQDGNELQAAFVQFELNRLQTALKLDAREIGTNEAKARSLQNQTVLVKAVEMAFRGFGDEIIKGIDLQEQMNRAIEDAQIKAGLLTGEKARQLLIDRQLAEFMKQYPDASAGAIAKYREAISTVKKELTETEELGKSIVQTFADGLGNAIMSVFDKAQSLNEVMSNILKQVANLLINFGIQAGLRGLFPSLFKSAMGNVMTERGPMPLKKYARGGITSGPVLSLAGEAGPEAIVPLPDGRSIPVRMVGAGGDVNVTVNVDASGTNVQGNEPDARQLGRAVSAAVQAELVKQQRPGGLLAGTR